MYVLGNLDVIVDWGGWDCGRVGGVVKGKKLMQKEHTPFLILLLYKVRFSQNTQYA